MELRQYDNKMTDAIYSSYFNNVQNNIKDLLLQKPYNVDDKDVEDFNDRLIKQFDSNEDKIKATINDNMNKQVDAKQTAKQLLDLYFNKTKINYYNNDSVNDIENTLKERKIFTYKQFVNENKHDIDDEINLDYICENLFDDEEIDLEYICRNLEIEIDVQIFYVESGNYFHYGIYHRYVDEENDDISYEIFVSYEDEIHQALVKEFEAHDLDKQLALTYLAYITTMNFSNLLNDYIIELAHNKYIIYKNDTVYNFISTFFDSIQISNLKNIDNFIIDRLQQEQKECLKSREFKLLFNYAKKETKDKYEHLFHASNFDLL